MAGHAAGDQPRAPLLEGSDLSPANAPFLARGGEKAQDSKAGLASEDQGMQGGKHLLNKS